MKIHKVTETAKTYKPKMKALKSIEEIPIDTTPEDSYREHRTIITAKLDGEFSLFTHTPESTYTLNGWGTMRTDFPAVNEARESLLRLGNQSYALKAELYAVEEGTERPVQLHEFLSLAKGKNADPERLRLGFWDIENIDWRKVMMSYQDRLNMMGYWFIGRKYCRAVPFIKPDNHDDIRGFWDDYVVNGGHEGIVVHVGGTSLYDRFNGGDIYKLKPLLDVDVVIIALNKTKVWKERKVGSIKVALLTEDGRLVELSDVSIPAKKGLRETAWNFNQYKISEDSENVWIKPQSVVKVIYNETIPAEKQTWRFKDGQYIKDKKIDFVSLKHPRLAHFRTDKEVNPTDLRMSQIAGFP